MQNWIEIIVSVLSGIAVVIPVVAKLVEYIVKYIKGQRWDDLINIVISYMIDAELLFDEGSSRKDWVMQMVKTSSEIAELGEIDMDKVSKLIDALCKTAKHINVISNNGTMNAGE